MYVGWKIAYMQVQQVQQLESRADATFQGVAQNTQAALDRALTNRRQMKATAPSAFGQPSSFEIGRAHV